MTTANLVKRINESPARFALALHGPTSEIVTAWARQARGWSNLIDMRTSTHVGTLADWIGARSEPPCGPHCVRTLAMATFRRALTLETGVDHDHLAAVACLHEVVDDQEPRTHWVHAGVQTVTKTLSGSLRLTGRDRGGEVIAAANRLVRNYMALACGIPLRPDDGLDGRDFVASHTQAPEGWGDLVRGAKRAICETNRADLAKTGGPMALFPGAFNPLHRGHRQMFELACQRLQCDIAWELSVDNVDKPMLDFTEIAKRVRQFRGTDVLWLTRAPTFVEKSELFPQATFVVGADTLVRITDPRYYGNDPVACQEAVARIADRGCRFLVFGRRAGGRFVTLPELAIPEPLRAVCQGVGENDFRADISSTQLRDPSGPNGGREDGRS